MEGRKEGNLMCFGMAGACQPWWWIALESGRTGEPEG